MIRGTGVGIDAGRMGSPARQSNEGINDGLQQAVPVALVTNSPPRSTAAIRDRVRREIAAYRQRAENAERGRQLATDQLAQLQLKIDQLSADLAERTEALTTSQALNNGLKRRVEALQNADSHAWADEPAKGKEALDLLFPGGVAAEPLRVMGIRDRWTPGTLRNLFLMKKEDVCACKRELAVNGLKNPKQRFDNVAILGEGGYGVVRRGRCKITRKQYAIKLTSPGNEATILAREMAAYAILDAHKYIIGVEALSDVAGGEGIVMELAMCDLNQAVSGKSETKFTVSQQIGFEADATEALHYMHGSSIVHCDHKLPNILICRSGGPMGFVGKVTDPGVWYGVGEMRIVGTGTVGWSPLENVHVEVEAAPAQDTFAVGVDLCSIVAHPDMKKANGVLNMWSHPKLMTAGERDRLQALRAEGSDFEQLRAEVTLRTMTDGSLSRIFLQPCNLNPALPPNELLKLCEMLGQTVSGDPTDRPDMPVVTAFLRDLARKTAAREETLADVPPEIDLPQDMAIPVAPLVVAPHAEGEGDDTGDAVPLLEVIEAPRGSVPRASAPPAAPVGPAVLPDVFPAVAPHSAGEEDDVGAAVPLAEVIEAPRGSVLRDSAPPAAPLGPVVLPVVAPHAAGEEGGAGAAVPLVGAIDAPHESAPRDSAPPAVEAEHANAAVPSPEETAPGAPSMELGHLAPPPVAEIHAEGKRDGAGDDVPLAAIQAPADSGPPAAAPLAQVEATDADMACLEEIKECAADLLSRPFPASPAEVLANHMVNTLRILRCPPPTASSFFAVQAYGGGGGGGGGSGDSGNGNGSGGSGSDSGGGVRGRTVARGESRGVSSGLTGVRRRRPLMAGLRPF